MGGGIFSTHIVYCLGLCLFAYSLATYSQIKTHTWSRRIQPDAGAFAYTNQSVTFLLTKSCL